MIDPKSGCKDSIVSGFSKAKHLTVWEKGQVPQRLHFGSNSRIGSLIVVADSAYLLGWPGAIKKEAGAHGYDNQNSDMHAIFYAMGPAFKQGYYPSFENVNLYALMAFILKLSPVKTDGNIGQVRYMLK
jgi:alkaline phosphatase D